MPTPRRKTKPQQTWSGLEEPDVTGSDEAEEAMPIEFLLGRLWQLREPAGGAPPAPLDPSENVVGQARRFRHRFPSVGLGSASGFGQSRRRNSIGVRDQFRAGKVGANKHELARSIHAALAARGLIAVTWREVVRWLNGD